MTKRDAAIIMAYTGYVTLQGENLVEYGRYVSEILGRPVFTHEIPSLSDEIREKSKPDFIRLCESATDTKAKRTRRTSTDNSYNYNSERSEPASYDDGWGGFEPDNSRYTGERKSNGDWECMGF